MVGHFTISSMPQFTCKSIAPKRVAEKSCTRYVALLAIIMTFPAMRLMEDLIREVPWLRIFFRLGIFRTGYIGLHA